MKIYFYIVLSLLLGSNSASFSMQKKDYYEMPAWSNWSICDLENEKEVRLKQIRSMQYRKAPQAKLKRMSYELRYLIKILKVKYSNAYTAKMKTKKVDCSTKSALNETNHSDIADSDTPFSLFANDFFGN